MNYKIINNNLTFNKEFVSKLMKGFVFDPINIARERTLSYIKPTIAFDLAGTLMDQFYRKERVGFHKTLEELKKQDIRLVVWTNELIETTRDFFIKHPHLLKYFDIVITCENSANTFENSDDSKKSMLATYFPNKTLSETKQQEYFSNISSRLQMLFDFDATLVLNYVYGNKDLSILGYHLLVDDTEIYQEWAKLAPFGNYNVYTIPRFILSDPEQEDFNTLHTRLIRMLNV